MGLNILGIVGIAVCGVALVLSIAAVAVNDWSNEENSTHELKVGLWKLCVKVKSGGSETCDDLELDSTSFTDEQASGTKATRAFLILGIIVAPGAIVAAVLVLFVMKDKEILFFAAAGVAFASGLMHMIAFAVYAGQVKTESYDEYSFGAGFALTIVAWIMNWVVGGLFIGAKMMKSKD